MFTHSVFNLKKFQEMNGHCPVCQVNFEPETGFYWGAMYISYAISVALSVTLAIAIRVIFGPGIDINVYIGSIIGIMVLFAPMSFRLSRAILLHGVANIKYDPNFEWDGILHEDDQVIK
jgi:hypothetical protein